MSRSKRMPAISLEMVKHAVGAEPREARVEVHTVVIAGFTGRDSDAVEAHIAELEAIGVKRPMTVPVFYRVSPSNLSTAPAHAVLGDATSGEVEFVLLKLDDGLWVGAGSDHTDRDAEARCGVAASKQLCGKPVAQDLWRLDDLVEHWDQLMLRSWATIAGERVLYQEGAVEGMLPPLKLLARHDSTHEELPVGSAMFCGTLAARGGPRPAERFEFELEDPVLSRIIRHAYTIHPVPERQ